MLKNSHKFIPSHIFGPNDPNEPTVPPADSFIGPPADDLIGPAVSVQSIINYFLTIVKYPTIIEELTTENTKLKEINEKLQKKLDDIKNIVTHHTE